MAKKRNKNSLNLFDKFSTKFISTPEEKEIKKKKKLEKIKAKDDRYSEKKIKKINIQIEQWEEKKSQLDKTNSAKKIDSYQRKINTKKKLLDDWELQLKQRRFFKKLVFGIVTLGVIMLIISVMIYYI